MKVEQSPCDILIAGGVIHKISNVITADKDVDVFDARAAMFPLVGLI